MIARKLILSVLTLLLACGSAATWSQTGGDRLAEELNTLRQQQRQLERDVAQYQQSIDVLRGEGTGENEHSTALQTLEDQLRRSQQGLVVMARQETELVRQLLPSVATPAPEPEQILDDPEAEEVARLKALLHEYHATQALAAAADSDDNRADKPEQNSRPEEKTLQSEERREDLMELLARGRPEQGEGDAQKQYLPEDRNQDQKRQSAQGLDR